MIKINNICFSYTNGRPYIIENMKLDIKKGSYVSILGENGSAKSTLIKLILGLLKPNSGDINIDTNRIGYVPQRGDGFNSGFPVTVWEILKSHAKVIGKVGNRDIENLISILGIEGFKKNLIGNLSGGQQQKVFICRALLGNPELLILDEPSTGIDVKSQEEIYEVIKKLNKENKITVIAVEHNIDAALKNSSHILRMENCSGKLCDINTFKYDGEGVINYASI